MTATRVFWVDGDYDRANASDGVSRYAAYVDRVAGQFAEDAEVYDDPAAAFAVRAWNTACPPVMSPGYVAWHPRVLSAHAERDGWAGDLLLTVDLVSALPAPVARTAGWSWKSWEYWESFDRYDGPALRTAGRDKALLPTVTAAVLVPVALVFLAAGPEVPHWREAAGAVRAICQVLNGELGPIVAALDEGR